MTAREPLTALRVSLPTWDDCKKAVDGGYATHLQHFIYHNEPSDTHTEGFQTEAEFREQLANLIAYERQGPAPIPQSSNECVHPWYAIDLRDGVKCMLCNKELERAHETIAPRAWPVTLPAPWAIGSSRVGDQPRIVAANGSYIAEVIDDAAAAFIVAACNAVKSEAPLTISKAPQS